MRVKIFLFGRLAFINSALKNLFISPNNSDTLPPQGPARTIELLQEEWKSPSYGIVRLTRLFLLAILFCFPRIYIDLISRSTKSSTVACSRDLYAILRVSFIITVLLTNLYKSTLAVGIVIYLLLEMLLNLAGGALVWGRYSINPQRSLILSFMNYAEFIIAFAIFYLHWDCLSLKPLGVNQALYFSFVTATTVGFGDILPANSTGQIIVMAQLTVFVLFVLLFITTFLSRIVPEVRK